MLNGGGGTKGFEVVLTREFEVLAILMGGGHLKFPPFKRGTRNVLPCLEGGGRKQFWPHDFPIINDQSLRHREAMLQFRSNRPEARQERTQ